MLNSTLVELLSSLDKKELGRLDELVHSPYYNKKAAVTKLWKALKEYAPAFSSPGLTHEALYKKVFPGRSFNYGTMKNLIYGLTRLTEVFLGLEGARDNLPQKDKNLLEALLAKGLSSHFEKKFKYALETVEQRRQEVQYYAERHALEVLRQNYLITADKHYETLSSIQEANRYLTLAYFIDVFVNNYNAAFIKTELSWTGGELNDFVRAAVSYYRASPVKADHTAAIYYNAFMLVHEGAEEYFYTLKKLLDDNIEKLSSEQRYNFYVALANYAGTRAEGSAEFTAQEFAIYRHMMESSIYSISTINTIDGNFYRKAASAAENAGEFQWAYSFINGFRDKLDEAVRENYYNHAMVEYYLGLGDFESALGLLARIKHTNPVDKLNIKTWQVMCLYELGYFEELRGAVDSTRHFISSDKKIAEPRKQRLYNFITVVSRLLGIKEGSSSESGVLISRELGEMNVSHKSWLKKKAGML